MSHSRRIDALLGVPDPDAEAAVAFHAAPVAMIRVDEEGQIDLANNAARDLFGVTWSLVGNNVSSYVAANFAEQHNELIKALFDEPHTLAGTMASGRLVELHRCDKKRVMVRVRFATTDATGKRRAIACMTPEEGTSEQ